MTRVAKARLKAGLGAIDDLPAIGALEDARVAPRVASSAPWNLGEPDSLEPGPEAADTGPLAASADLAGVRPWPRVQPIDGDHADAAEGEHTDLARDERVREAAGRADAGLVSLVRRVFLPAPIGADARTVLFCMVDGEPGPDGACMQAARILARETARTVCTVNSVDDGEDDPAGALARPVAPNLWRARDLRRLFAAGSAARRWFAEFRARFDFVLLDAAAATGEAIALAPLVDGVILLVDELTTRRESARSAADTLERAGGRLMGVILTNQSHPIPDALYRRL